MRRIQTNMGNPQNQKKIEKEDIDIASKEKRDSNSVSLTAKVKLGKLHRDEGVDGNSIVRLHVTSQYREDIYDMGTVAAPFPIAGMDISKHGSRIRYRVYVCPSDSPEIIAKSTWAKLIIRENNEGRKSGILTIVPRDDMDELVWRLDIDDDDGPILFVNNKAPIKEDIQSSKKVQAYLIPEIIRQVLTKLHEEICEGNDSNWVNEWKRWIESNGYGLPDSDSADDESQKAEWAQEIATRFATDKKMMQQMVDANSYAEEDDG